MTTDALALFESAPRDCGLFLDFDGTLAEIVDDPAAARPLEGVDTLLSELTRELGLVAVVSGRSARQLVDWLGPEVEIWGLHGAERAVKGEVVLADAAAEVVPVMRRVVAEARAAAPDDIEVEDKTAMVGLHYRKAHDRALAAAEVERIARDLAQRHALLLGRGRLVVELRPPVEFSKADVIARRARDLDLRGAAFAGDDTVDLPAFDALDDLARDGTATLRIAVASDEAPDELLDRADVVVDGPRGLLGWLRGLRG